MLRVELWDVSSYGASYYWITGSVLSVEFMGESMGDLCVVVDGGIFVGSLWWW